MSAGHVRLDFATSPKRLTEAVRRMASALLADPRDLQQGWARHRSRSGRSVNVQVADTLTTFRDGAEVRSPEPPTGRPGSPLAPARTCQ